MPQFPVADPGRPPTGSVAGFLAWLAARQWPLLLGGTLFGLLWMLAQALIPAAMGYAVDQGIVARDNNALVRWSGAVLALGLIAAGAGVMRHRFAVTSWLDASYRTTQLVVDRAVTLGASLPRRMPLGEIVAVGTSDTYKLSSAMEIVPRAISSLAAIVVVVTFMLRESVPLGLAVAFGVPLMMAVTGPMLRPVHRRQQRYRDIEGDLTSRANDIMSGLRVLRGVGGEDTFEASFRRESQALYTTGVRLARVESVLWSMQVLLPGLLLAVVVWLGATLSLAGHLTAGDLVAFYGYATFLGTPMHTLAAAIDHFVRAHVAGRRVQRIAALESDLPLVTTDPVPAGAAAPASLTDGQSGLVVRAGQLTAVAAADPAELARLADRLGRYTRGDARLNGVPLGAFPLGEVRMRILVADNDARLFAGRLRDELDPHAVHSDADVRQALQDAYAGDVTGDTVAERGRNFSGGQQQRRRLARALLADPEVLVLVEPTSAVDAHTEAAIAARLKHARSGQTTVVMTTSPLLLDQAERVVYVVNGRVAATGTHRSLLQEHTGYADTVTRGES